MEHEPLLSIIIPVYNLEKYISKCIDSILNQSFADYELLIIDDGSTDTSYDICCGYGRKDSRLHVFHQDNGGVSSARNFGLDNARGEYIAFVDGDDIIEQEMFAHLMLMMDQPDVGIAACGLDRVAADGSHRLTDQIVSGCMTSKEAAALYFEEGFVKESMYGPYNKVFRRSCIDGIRFKPYRYGEDVLFVFEALHNTETICFDHFIGYHYVERAGSAVRSTFSLDRLDYVEAAREVEKNCAAYFPEAMGAAHHWVYRLVLTTVLQLYREGLDKSASDYISHEKRYLKENASCLSALSFRFRIYYLMVEMAPSLIKPVYALTKR